MPMGPPPLIIQASSHRTSAGLRKERCNLVLGAGSATTTWQNWCELYWFLQAKGHHRAETKGTKPLYRMVWVHSENPSWPSSWEHCVEKNQAIYLWVWEKTVQRKGQTVRWHLEGAQAFWDVSLGVSYGSVQLGNDWQPSFFLKK